MSTLSQVRFNTSEEGYIQVVHYLDEHPVDHPLFDKNHKPDVMDHDHYLDSVIIGFNHCKWYDCYPECSVIMDAFRNLDELDEPEPWEFMRVGTEDDDIETEVGTKKDGSGNYLMNRNLILGILVNHYDDRAETGQRSKTYYV